MNQKRAMRKQNTAIEPIISNNFNKKIKNKIKDLNNNEINNLNLIR